LVIRIATRRSKLALAQSHWVKARLEALEAGIRAELREYVTRGDRVQDVPLAQVGGKGLFTKEIEDALLAGDADLAVHSLKDLPAELPPGLTLAAVPEREDPRDAVVLPEGRGERGGGSVDLLEPEARVGSSSLRRTAQLLHARPDLRIESVRGNVDTRLRKLDDGEYDALILAAAGLRRLGLEERISALLPVEVSTPAPGQGALGLECRADDGTLLAVLSRLEDPVARACVTAERALMDAVGGGCSVPLGAFAEARGAELYLTAVLAAADGSRLVRRSAAGDIADPAGLGARVGDLLLNRY
jgi:hydroxymethylbilane synthase